MKHFDRMPSLTGPVEVAYDGYGGHPSEELPCGTPVKFYFDQLLHNNFGDVGPDRGDPVMRLRVTKHDPTLWCEGGVRACDKHMIVEVRPKSSYRGTRHNHNGLNGSMAIIGLDTGKSVDVEFYLYDPKTGRHIVPESFPITFFDVDSDPDGRGQEFVVPKGNYYPFLEKQSKIDFEVSPGISGGSVMYLARPGSSLSKNPNDPYNLTQEQRERCVAFEYRNPDTVEMTIGSMFGPDIRIFSFSLFSVLKPCPFKLPRPPREVTDWRFVTLMIFAFLGLFALAVFIAEKFWNPWRYRYRLMDLPVPSGVGDRKSFAKDALRNAFNAKDSWRYRCALELALDAGVPAQEIPLVLQLCRHADATSYFAQPDVDIVSVELCFVLDHTGSMAMQLAQVKQCLANLSDEAANVTIPNRPNAKVALSVSAVAYSDFDEKSRSLKVPVVSVFGGGRLDCANSEAVVPDTFKFGGRFTRSAEALANFLDQPLGHGRCTPEELTGALIAASDLPWSAEIRLCFVITDAPCHGKDYHSFEEDDFVNSFGLSGSGRPEDALNALREKEVGVSILHSGPGLEAMLAKFKEVLPDLQEGTVPPDKTGVFVIRRLKDALRLQPLTYLLRVYDLQDLDKSMVPAPDVRMQVRSRGKDERHFTAGADGLMWIGYPRKEFGALPEAVILRGADFKLDSHWERESTRTRMCTEFKEGFKTILHMPAHKI